jgi:hypothetical protein
MYDPLIGVIEGGAGWNLSAEARLNSRNRPGAACSLFLPALAYADHDNAKGNDFENRGTGSQKDPPVTVVPGQILGSY